MSNHKLSGCIARANSQIDRARLFLSVVMPVLPENEEDPNRQFLYQSTIVMLQSFFEEYLRCVVSIGTFWKPEDVRRYLAQCYSDQDFAAVPAADIGLWAQKRVSFDDRAVRLKQIFNVLFGVAPFADQDAEGKCLDFVSIRNLIAHRGGWPDQSVADSILSANVVVESKRVGNSIFYALRINREFFGEGLSAIARSILALETSLAQNPTYKLPG